MQLKSLIESFVKKVTDTAQNLLQQDEQSERHSINELVAFIKEDKGTSKTSRTLLGMEYHQYSLTKEDFQFNLETKGSSSEKVLYLTIFEKGIPILQYRSYDSKFSLDKSIKIPVQLSH